MILQAQPVRARAIPHEHRGYSCRLVVWTSLAPFHAERATVLRTLWLAMPVGLLLATAGGWIIGWRLLAPLSSMVRQANAIDDRRLDARITVPGTGDELSTLATAFNNLLERVAVGVSGAATVHGGRLAPAANAVVDREDGRAGDAGEA